MKIAHISDLHIRNFKYRSEYNAAFNDLYAQLRELKPDIIINTGDTVHSKLAVSPELFDDVAQHMLQTSEIAPYWLILGNHDLNLKNVARTDAISPVVRAIKGRTRHEVELLGPGVHIPPFQHTRFRFYNYDIRGHEDFVPSVAHINVGLYHGSISGCTTDIGFTMEEGEAEVSKFAKMHYVLLGDIHKRQSFRDGRIWYPGSLIQQNYGEELEKGFLLWDIFDDDNAVVDFHPVRTHGRFFTVQVGTDLAVDLAGIPKGSRIRAVVAGELTPSKRIELERSLRESLEPAEVITPDSSGERLQMEVPDIDELIGSRDKVMLDHLKERGVTDEMAEAVVKLFHEYEAAIDTDGGGRGTTWILKRIAWDNMMNYGEGNVIDMTKLSGLVGVFAPNASGKSSIFDIFLEALFDKISKDVPRNIDLINDNKDNGTMAVEFEAAGTPFSIERSIERISYGQRKLAEVKQWGKTSLDFSSVDESLNGTSRPETERTIRQIIGSFEDFTLTSMVTQNPIFGLPGGGDLLNCRETDRRKILFRFLDLDAFERISNDAKEDHKALMGTLKGQDHAELTEQLEGLLRQKGILEAGLAMSQLKLNSDELKLDELTQRLAAYNDVVNLEVAATSLAKTIERQKTAVESQTWNRDQLGLVVSRLRNELVTHREKQPAVPSISLDRLVETISTIRTKREDVLVNISRSKMRNDQGIKSLSTLEGVPCEGKFPSCRFISEASRFLQERDTIAAAIEQLTAEAADASAELVRYEDMHLVHKQASDWERRATALELEISQKANVLQGNTTDLDRGLAKLAEYELELNEVQRKLAASVGNDAHLLREEQRVVAVNLKAGRNRRDNDLKQVGAIDARIEQTRAGIKALDGLKERLQIHEHLLEMCGKNGLPYRILALVLPVINAEISKILSGIVKFSVFFEDDPEEQTVSLFIRYGDYKSRPLSLGSGAEKFIASLAIRVALLSVSSLPKTDILIIDEGFGKLDPEHLEALQRMFEYLKGAFGTVFVVSHVDFMRDIVDHSIEITSQDGYAHVEVT